MTDLHKSRLFLWVLFILFTIAWFCVLDIRALVPPDEGRYAEMAREMLASGDWITTRLNDIKYFEKPPFQTWMNALTFKLFGLGEWQARLWTGFAGFLAIVLVAYTGLKVFSARVGFYAALVLGSSWFWVGASQFNSLDMGVSGMMTLALCSLLIAQRDSARTAERRNWMLACWAGMALAVLSKGPIGVVLPGAVIVIYTLVTRDWALWSRLHMGKGLLLFFAIAAPWFVLVSMKNPEFPHFFFIHEHVERFLLKTHHREGAWYYFFVILAGGMLPWISLIPQSLAKGWRSKPSSVFNPKLLLLIWAIFIFTFFSYSSSKLPGYILPIFPAMALLIAAHLEKASRRSRLVAAGTMSVLGIVGLVLAPKIAKLSTIPQEVPFFQAFQPWVMAACFIALSGGLLSMLYTKQLRRDLSVFSLAIAGFISAQLLLAGYAPFGNYRTGMAMLPAIKGELTPQTKLYAVGKYDQSLTFHLRHPMVLADYLDEFEFGLQQEPRLAVPTLDAFVDQWLNEPKALALASPKAFEELQKRGVPMRVVTQDARRVLISNILNP